jgi:uncharacterized membrane protein
MDDRPLTFAPVQMLSVAFDGNRFKGEILPELERLKDAGVVRIVDLLLVRKDKSGAVATVKASDLDWEEATRFGAYIGTLIGYGVSGEEGAERGAIVGAAELADGHVFDEEEQWRLIEAVPDGASVAIVLLEHLWMLPLLAAIERANGLQLENDWVSLEDLVRAGLEAPGEL